VLRDEIEVVAVGMERRDFVLRPADPVERVVVVETDVGYPLGAQQLDAAVGERRFAGARVAHEAQHDRSPGPEWHHAPPFGDFVK